MPGEREPCERVVGWLVATNRPLKRGDRQADTLDEYRGGEIRPRLV